MADTHTDSAAQELAAVLKQQLGQDQLKQDPATLELMSQDIWAKGRGNCKAWRRALVETDGHR